MMRNPFIAGRPIRYGEPFCGREDEVRFLQREATNGNLMVLYAFRRFGKTSLLNHLAGRLQEAAWTTLRFDLTVIAGMADLVRCIDTELSRFSSIGSKIRSYLAKTRLSMGASLDPATQLPGLEFALNSATDEQHGPLDLLSRLRVLATLPEIVRGPVLALFDEFQEILYMQDNKDNIYEKLFRSAFQDRSAQFSAVFSGSKPSVLRKLFSDRQRMFYRGVQSLELGPIERDEFVSFACREFRVSLEVDLPEKIPSLVHAFLAGHPYGLQKIMYLVWNGALGAQEQPDWPEIVRSALREFCESERSDFEKSWQDLTPVQRKVLLVTALFRGNAPFSKQSLARIGLGQSTVQRALGALEGKGRIVKKTSPARNSYEVFDSIDRLCLRLLAGTPLDEIIDPLVSAVFDTTRPGS